MSRDSGRLVLVDEKHMIFICVYVCVCSTNILHEIANFYKINASFFLYISCGSFYANLGMHTRAQTCVCVCVTYALWAHSTAVFVVKTSLALPPSLAPLTHLGLPHARVACVCVCV